MRYISLIALIFLCSGVLAQDDEFFYYIEEPQFQLGKEIVPIKPYPERDGKYTSSNEFLEGLKLDERTGVISGTPQVATYFTTQITYTSDDGTVSQTTGLSFIIFEVPEINCGVSEMTISTPIRTRIYCTSSEFIVTDGWAMTPAHHPGITLEDGVLTFDRFYPENDMTITVTGQGYVATGSYSFKVKKLANPEYKDGIWVTAYQNPTKECGEMTDDLGYYSKGENAFDNLDGLIDQRGWREKMSLFHNTIFTMNATMIGFIDIQTDGDYTFYMQTGDNMYARVAVNNVQILSDWEQCNKWNEEPITNKTTLSKGYVPIYIELRGGNKLDFKFVLQYSTPNDDTKKSIPFKYIQPKFQPVAFLRIDAEKISWLNDAFSLTPIHVGMGTADKCELSGGTLPEGSKITTEAITGHPQKDMDYQTFTMVCSNNFTKTNEVTFQLRVTSKYLNGLVAYFYKPYNFDTSLRTKYGPSTDGIEPSFIQVVDDAFISESGDGTKHYPEGTNMQFFDDYAVYFEGYLKIGKNQPGNYKFKLQGEGGYWLYIDNKLVVEKPGRHSYSEETIVDFTLTDDYYFYQIYYVTHLGNAHFEIISKHESSDVWDGLLTDVFVPSYDYFVFKQRYASYLVGQKVENPIIEVENSILNCIAVKVSPPLPEGLLADCSKIGFSSAIIMGTPTEYTSLHQYKVTIKDMDGSEYSYPVEIEVKTHPEPDGLYLVDLNTGKRYYDSMNLQIGKFYDLKVKLTQGYFTMIIASVIPGFMWDPLTYTLSGSARDDQNHEIDFIVMSEVAMVPKTFKFSFTANNTCENGLIMHSFRMTSNITDQMQGCRIWIRIGEFGDYVVKYNEVITSLPHTELKCLEPGEYTIMADGYDNYRFSVYSGGYKVFEEEAPGTIMRKLIDTKPGAPEFHYYTDTIELYSGYDILLIPIVTGAAPSKYTIDKELPEGLNFDPKTGRIDGVVPDVSRLYGTTYNITAVNDYVSHSVYLDIRIMRQDIFEERCLSQDKIVLTVITQVEDSPDDMGYRLINSKNNITIERGKGSFVANRTYNLRRCVEPDWYTLQLVSYSMYGWRSGNVKIKVGSSIIGKYAVEYRDVKYELNAKSVWQYSQAYVNDWMFKNCTECSSRFQSSTIPALYPMKTDIPTFYLRYQLSIEKDKYTGYLIRYMHKSGVIVRINGIEIFRENLPSGDVPASDFASSGFDSLTERKFILPIKDLEEGAIISFEIHKASSDFTFPSQDQVFLLPLDGDNEEDCILLSVYDGKITESSSKSCSENPFCVEKAFDVSSQGASYWEDKYTSPDSQSFATLKFGEGGYYGFNQFYMQAGAEKYDHYPSHVKVLGMVGQSTSQLKELNPVYYFKDSPSVFISRATFNNDPYKLYSGMRIEIPKSNQPDSHYAMRVFEINYQLCRERICDPNTAESLPEGKSNHIYEVNCTEGGVGTRKFYCSNKKNWIEIENKCDEKPTFINPPLKKEFKRGHAYNDEAIFLVSGNSITYSHSLGNEFVPGLTFNYQNGHVSGTPTQVGSWPVTFTISNSKGGNSHTMDIIVVEGASDIVIVAYNSTLTWNLYETYEPRQIFWVESTEPVKYSAKNLPIDLSIHPDTGLFGGRPEQEGEGVYTFTLENSKGKVEVNVKITIVASDDVKIVDFMKEVKLIYGEGYNNIKPLLCNGKGIAYSVDKQLPKDLVYDEKTGGFSGQVFAEPQAPVTYKFTCTSSNGKSQSKDIPVSVTRDDDAPVLISKIDKVELTVGEDVNKAWFEVKGNGLSYHCDVLPMGLHVDEKTGLIMGYPTEPYRSRDITFFVKNGNDKEIHFELNLTVKPTDKPVIPDSSVYKNVSIPTGKAVSEKIFDPLGDDIVIDEINPPLPAGFTINKQGYLQGLAVYDIPKTTYRITVMDKNGKKTSVEIPLEFVSLKCAAQDGYPATPVGEIAVKKCGGSKTGFLKRRCLSSNGQAVWQKEIDECSSSNTGALVGIIIGCIIGGGVIFLGGYCLYVRLGGTTKHVRKTAEHMVDSKDSGVRI